MSFNRGDVVIALFPNADGSSPKARPVLVVQSNTYNARIKNLIVAAITTKDRQGNNFPPLPEVGKLIPGWS